MSVDPVEPEVEDSGYIEETIRSYRKMIRDTPALLSLLYDIDLLPEQIRLPVNALRMSAVCELWKLKKEDENGLGKD